MLCVPDLYVYQARFIANASCAYTSKISLALRLKPGFKLTPTTPTARPACVWPARL